MSGVPQSQYFPFPLKPKGLYVLAWIACVLSALGLRIHESSIKMLMSLTYELFFINNAIDIPN